MSTKEMMRSIVNESGLTLATIAEKAGYKRITNVSEFLRSENMRVDNMVRILNACGYKVIIKPERKDLAERELVVE